MKLNYLAAPLALLALAASAASAADTNAARVTTVILFIDDMGYVDIGLFGATKQRTPNLDRLAHSGEGPDAVEE